MFVCLMDLSQAKWVKLRVKIAEEEYLQCLQEIGMTKIRYNLISRKYVWLRYNLIQGK
jgi:hypothetical protein